MDGGKTAILSQNGKHLLVTITNGDGAFFQMLDAKPLPTSPMIIEQDPNEGIRKLAIYISPCEKIELAVEFVDYYMESEL